MAGQPRRTAEGDVARGGPVARRNRLFQRLPGEEPGEDGAAEHVAAAGGVGGAEDEIGGDEGGGDGIGTGGREDGR